MFLSELSKRLFWRTNVAFWGHDVATATWIVTVFEFVRIDKVTLILVLVISLRELGRERSFDRLIVSRVAALMHVDREITTAHRWCILANHVILYLVLIVDAHLFLVTTSRLNISSLLPLFSNERFLGIGNACSPATLIANAVSGALVELVMIAELLHIFLVHRRFGCVKVLI